MSCYYHRSRWLSLILSDFSRYHLPSLIVPYFAVNQRWKSARNCAKVAARGAGVTVRSLLLLVSRKWCAQVPKRRLLQSELDEALLLSAASYELYHGPCGPCRGHLGHFLTPCGDDRQFNLCTTFPIMTLVIQYMISSYFAAFLAYLSAVGELQPSPPATPSQVRPNWVSPIAFATLKECVV